jgi:hypothetical protein
MTKSFISHISLSLRIFLCNSSKTIDSRSNRNGTGSRESVGTSGNDLAARLAVPNTSTRSLHTGLSAESTTIRRMLRNFNLAHQLSKRRTISGSILSRNSNLFCAFSHFWLPRLKMKRRRRSEYRHQSVWVIRAGDPREYKTSIRKQVLAKPRQRLGQSSQHTVRCQSSEIIAVVVCRLFHFAQSHFHNSVHDTPNGHCHWHRISGQSSANDAIVTHLSLHKVHTADFSLQVKTVSDTQTQKCMHGMGGTVSSTKTS